MADDVRHINGLETHAARILLLLAAFHRIDGLTKIAKLDFLLRYPSLLESLAESLSRPALEEAGPTAAERVAVESRMVRYKYGPWDDRYYPVIGMLVGMGLAVPVDGEGGATLQITDLGQAAAANLVEFPEWTLLNTRCQYLAAEFDLSGNALKEAIYQHLPGAVDRPWRVAI